MEKTPVVVVAVPLSDADPAMVDPALVADRLFMLGASAVLEREAPGGGSELVADVPAGAVDGLPRGARVLGPADSAASWAAPPTTVRCGRRLVVRATPTSPESADPGDPGGPDPGDHHSGDHGPGSHHPRARDRPGVSGADARDGDVVVRVGAGHAFGTGSHASTRLCLELLEGRAPGAATVLDVGCGTGVLGVAALLLGAGSVRAIDVDPVAVEATAVAAHRNGVSDRLTVDDSALSDVAGTFDLVLANLLAPILEDLGADLAARLAPGGAMVVGGVLAEQVDRVVAALDTLQLVDSAAEGDWVSLVLAPRPVRGRS